MDYKKYIRFSVVYLIMIVFLIVRWKINYRNVIGPLQQEDFIYFLTDTSSFTSIKMLFSMYCIMFCILLCTSLPSIHTYTLYRINRNSYVKRAVLSVLITAVFFSLMINTVRSVLLIIDYVPASHVLQLTYMTAFLLNVAFWTICFSIYGCLFLFLYIAINRKWIAILLIFLGSVLLLIASKEWGIQTLFMELSIFADYYSAKGLNLYEVAICFIRLFFIGLLIYECSIIAMKRKDVLHDA